MGAGHYGVASHTSFPEYGAAVSLGCRGLLGTVLVLELFSWDLLRSAEN